MEKPIIDFKYKFENNYNPVYVNGAFGGIGPLGEIIINFFLERQPIPYEEKVELIENNVLGETISINPEEHKTSIVRYVTTGVVMNLETSKKVHEWLGQHIQRLEELKGVTQND